MWLKRPQETQQKELAEKSKKVQLPQKFGGVDPQVSLTPVECDSTGVRIFERFFRDVIFQREFLGGALGFISAMFLNKRPC